MPDDIREPGGEEAVLTVLTIDDLHAYIDGELSADLVAEVEDVLRDDPRAVRWLAAYRHQIACMYRVFGEGAEDVPDRLRQVVRAALSP